MNKGEKKIQGFIIGLVIIVNLILQSTLLQYFKIYNVLPNTALILVISFSMYSGKNQGAIIGLSVGMLQDIIFGRIVGLNAFVYMLIGYFVGLINRKVFKDNLLIPVALTAVGTVLYETVNMLFLCFLKYRIELFNVFKKMLVVEVLYNSIFSILIYIYVSKLFQTKKKKRH
ncbi:rod shape-determining protein MreD [Alkaliphilus hydrothermalis]|uniref:Rod shape-determining protein MreD n=1 Tax=Alkaliphilus hydrothermalis TaxID=1482730 RepID=A0ABS2NKV8_9FIRM|nr:rod shape-determining protein MreD [Alkaliphilus hydrothermalis]MBM7613580.1 rod shape-determining protein MreD [Alkaliphilus hydrothermalis]